MGDTLLSAVHEHTAYTQGKKMRRNAGAIESFMVVMGFGSGRRIGMQTSDILPTMQCLLIFASSQLDGIISSGRARRRWRLKVQISGPILNRGEMHVKESDAKNKVSMR